MVKKIISTIFARTLLAGLTFALAVVTSRYLGPAGKGDVSLFMLNLTIVQLINNFIGGPYLVYLVPRNNIMHLLLPSYAWAILTSVLVPLCMLLLNLQDIYTLMPLMLISFLYSVISINTMIMTGKEEVHKYNITALVQAFILIALCIIYFEYYGMQNLSSYIYALYFSSAIAFVVSFFFILKHLRKISFANSAAVFYETLKNGFVVQAGNIAQMFNYRLSFYLLDKLHTEGRREVGLYSVAVSVAEALWLIGHSVALILYSRISNSADLLHSRKLTLTLIKTVFLCTLVSTAILLCVPTVLFEYVFGNGFGAIKEILFPLSFGIIIFSAGIIISAYFVGVGKPQVSVIASCIGLVITLVLGFFLIPKYGMIGAAITASISYTAGVVYQFVRFMKEAQELNVRDFIFSKNDFDLVSREFKNALMTNKSKT